MSKKQNISLDDLAKLYELDPDKIDQEKETE